VFGLVLALFQLGPQTQRTIHFQNCAAARAADVAPIREGQPGYAPHLDRDNDGLACEPWPR
jgi:hypothetical protein